MAPKEVISLSGIAHMLGVSRQAAKNRMDRGTLPRPDWFSLSGRAYWNPETIEAAGLVAHTKPRVNRPGSAQEPLADRQTWVYRAFDADDALLYVGVTVAPQARMIEHAGCRRNPLHWWSRLARVAWMAYPTRAEARAAEAQAIRTEGPLYNHDLNPNRPFIPPREVSA